MKSVVFISWQNEFNKKIVHFREFVYYFDHQAAKTKRWENLKMQTICRQNQTLKRRPKHTPTTYIFYID